MNRPAKQPVAHTVSGYSIYSGDRVCRVADRAPVTIVRRDGDRIVVRAFVPGVQSPSLGRVLGTYRQLRLPAPALGLV